MGEIIGLIVDKNFRVKIFLIIEVNQIKLSGTKYQNNSSKNQTKITSDQLNSVGKDGTTI